MKKTSLCFVDGDCEKSVVEWMKTQGFRFGRTRKLVLCEKKNLRLFYSDLCSFSSVVVILDIDNILADEQRKVTLLENMMYLSKVCRRLVIITQDKNLEDELQRSLHLASKRDLYQFFNAQGKSEFKSNLCNMSPISMGSKMKQIDFDKLWQNKRISYLTSEAFFFKFNGTLKNIRFEK